MSTTASSIRNIKPRLPTSNSINNMTTNGNEPKSNRGYFKKPLSATNILQNYPPPNGFNNHLKKRTILSNSHHQNKSTKSNSIEEKSNHHPHNGQHSTKQLTNNTTISQTPPNILHAIAPASSSQEINGLTKETSNEEKVF
jgi:hypothetical protein